MGRRITIRLGDEDYERLHMRSQDADLDFSFLVREAITKYLDSASADPSARTPATGLFMPPEAFALEGPYRAWCGDLRVELRKRFLELLALSHVTAEHWSKTSGIREVYAGLLALGAHLGIGEAVRHA
jgi:hypothetical protein